MSRIAAAFARLAGEGRSAFVAYVMAGDPDPARSAAIIAGLPEAGADLVEIGFPFTDPIADGPTIQRAGQRALAAGQTLAATLEMVRVFRARNTETPIVLMGYYNPIHNRGTAAFLAEAAAAGVDGLIVVDVPPEEDVELARPAGAAGLDFIRLTTPTTDDARLPRVVAEASGFVYYVSVTGTTGGAGAEAAAIAPAVARIRAASGLPVAVGFGVRTPEAARSVAGVADGVVVGSAIVERIERGEPTEAVLSFVAELAAAAHGG